MTILHTIQKKGTEEHPYGFKCAVCEGKVVSRNRGKQPCFECENGHLCDDGIHVESGELRVYDEKINGSLKHGVIHVEDARNEDPEEIKNRKQRRLDWEGITDKNIAFSKQATPLLQMWKTLSRAGTAKKALGANAADLITKKELGSIYSVANKRFYNQVGQLGITRRTQPNRVTEMLSAPANPLPPAAASPAPLSPPVQVTPAPPPAPAQQTMMPFMDKLSAMHTAKRLSDKKRWAGKHAILLTDMLNNPDAWHIDSRVGKFVGLTRSDGWRFHMPASKVPATIRDETQMLDAEKQAGYALAMEGYFSRQIKKAEWDRAYEPGDEGDIEGVRGRVAAREAAAAQEAAIKNESDELEKAHANRPTNPDYGKIPGNLAELAGQFKGYSIPLAGPAQMISAGAGYLGHGLGNLNPIGRTNALKNVKGFENKSWLNRFGTVAHDSIVVPSANTAALVWDKTMGDSKNPIARAQRIGPTLYRRPSTAWYSDTVQGIPRDVMGDSEKAVTNYGKNWLGNDSIVPRYLKGIAAGAHHAGSTLNYGGLNLLDSYKGEEWTTKKPEFWTPPQPEQ
jgi:hypothetical protein